MSAKRKTEEPGTSEVTDDLEPREDIGGEERTLSSTLPEGDFQCANCPEEAMFVQGGPGAQPRYFCQMHRPEGADLLPKFAAPESEASAEE
jgi:hypothetical protein